MRERLRRALAVASLLLVTLAGRPARALEGDVFDDYRRAGSGDESRQKPGPLQVAGMSIEPTLDWKLADILAPHVFLGETAGYSTNILRAPNGTKRKDVFSRTEGGVRTDLQYLEHVLSAEYRFLGYVFPAEDDLNALEHQARGRLDLNFLPGTVHAEGGWARSQFSRNLLIRGRIREDDYDVSGFARGDVSRFTIGAGAGFQRIDYLDKAELQPFDHKVFLATAQLGARVTSDLHVFANYNFQAVRFDRRLLHDYDVNGGRLGIQGKLGPKLSFSGAFGADLQQVRQKSGSIADDNEYKGFAAESSLLFRVFDQTELTLAYRHDLLWSPGSNFQVVDMVQLGVSQKFLDEKLIATAVFAYEHVDPSRAAPLDRLHPSLRVTWLVKPWLHTSLYYVYDRGFSKTKANDYEEHRVELSVGVGF